MPAERPAMRLPVVVKRVAPKKYTQPVSTGPLLHLLKRFEELEAGENARRRFWEPLREMPVKDLSHCKDQMKTWDTTRKHRFSDLTSNDSENVWDQQRKDELRPRRLKMLASEDAVLPSQMPFKTQARSPNLRRSNFLTSREGAKSVPLADRHIKGWAKRQDLKTRRDYYFHLPTGRAQWEPPPEFVEEYAAALKYEQLRIARLPRKRTALEGDDWEETSSLLSLDAAACILQCGIKMAQARKHLRRKRLAIERWGHYAKAYFKQYYRALARSIFKSTVGELLQRSNHEMRLTSKIRSSTGRHILESILRGEKGSSTDFKQATGRTSVLENGEDLLTQISYAKSEVPVSVLSKSHKWPTAGIPWPPNRPSTFGIKQVGLVAISVSAWKTSHSIQRSTKGS